MPGRVCPIWIGVLLHIDPPHDLRQGKSPPRVSVHQGVPEYSGMGATNMIQLARRRLRLPECRLWGHAQPEPAAARRCAVTAAHSSRQVYSINKPRYMGAAALLDGIKLWFMIGYVKYVETAIVDPRADIARTARAPHRANIAREQRAWSSPGGVPPRLPNRSRRPQRNAKRQTFHSRPPTLFRCKHVDIAQAQDLAHLNGRIQYHAARMSSDRDVLAALRQPDPNAHTAPMPSLCRSARGKSAPLPCDAMGSLAQRGAFRLAPSLAHGRSRSQTKVGIGCSGVGVWLAAEARLIHFSVAAHFWRR